MINAAPVIREAFLHGLGWGFIIGALLVVLVVNLPETLRRWRS